MTNATILYIDSFDGYQGTEVWTNGQYWVSNGIVSPPTVNTSSQRTGAGCLQPSAGGVIDNGWVGTQSSWLIGCGVYMNQTPIGNFPVHQLIYINTLNQTATPTGLYIGPDYLLHLVDAAGSSAVSTGSPLRTNQWFYIEWSGTMGLNQLNTITVDGAPVFSGNFSAQTVFGTQTLNSFTNLLLSAEAYLIDDFYFAIPTGTATIAGAGDASVFAQIPSGSGSFTQWTPTSPTGTNWENVETIPFSSSDYNQTDTSGKIDTYVCAVISGSGSGINDYTPSALASADIVDGVNLVQRVTLDTDTGAQVEPFLDISGGTYTASLAKWTPQTYKPQFTIFTTNPNAGSWTGTSVNATQWGIEHV